MMVDDVHRRSPSAARSTAAEEAAEKLLASYKTETREESQETKTEENIVTESAAKGPGHLAVGPAVMPRPLRPAKRLEHKHPMEYWKEHHSVDVIWTCNSCGQRRGMTTLIDHCPGSDRLRCPMRHTETVETRRGRNVDFDY